MEPRQRGLGIRTSRADEGSEIENSSVRPSGGRSQVSGDRSVPLLRLTIPSLLAATVNRHGAQDAAVFPAQGVRFSWHELAGAVDRLAAGLHALGLRKGDRVGIWSPNRWEWLVTQFATARIGLVLVNINPAYRLAELEYALTKVGCKALIAADRFKGSDYLRMIETLAPEIRQCAPGALKSAKLPELRAVIRLGGEKSEGMLNFTDVMGMEAHAGRAELDAISASLDPEDAINIQFTSGTSGAPKGATLTHYNIVNNANFVSAAIDLTHGDRLCIPVPLYHCFGMVMGVLGCVTKGAAMVFPGEGFDAAATLRAVEREKCTGLYGVPTMFVAMLDDPDFRRFDLASLRTGVLAGAPCPVELMKKIVSLMHMGEVTIAYGMTETSPVSFQSSVNETFDRRVSTVGRVHPHVEAKVIDDRGRVVSTGTPGELCIRGYSVMKGYWDDREKTSQAIDAEGWMHTGDLATIDEDGYCNIVGRVKDMVIRGGENIYPREIEEFLYRHPKISEAQVFGVPDPKYGEELCVWIVTAPGETLTEQEVRDFCAGNIAHFKVPRYVRFRDALPMTVTGKPQKFEMRAAMVEELKLTVERTA